MTVEERERRADAITARLASDGMAKAASEALQARRALLGRKREALGGAWLDGVLAALLVWPIFHNRRDD